MICERTYRVAGVDFTLRLPENSQAWNSLDNYSPFEVASSDTPAFTIHFREKHPFKELTKIPFPEPEDLNETKVEAFVSPDGWMEFEFSVNWKSKLSGTLCINSDFSEGYIDSLDTFSINNAMMLTFALRTMGMGILEMHSSVVVNDDIAYMFLGVSGTGKSTHSRLWMENIPGTWLLNDDNPVIRVTEGKVRVYGTPWSGKTPCYKNASAPVGAIVSLSQAPENKIRMESIPEGYASIYSSCSGIKFEKGFVDMIHETIVSIVSSVPCFHLDCLPDADAARVCRKAVAPSVALLSADAGKGIELPNKELIGQVCEFLSDGKEVIMMTKGYSMLPFIVGERDSVRLKKVESYSEGDVVLAEIAPGHYLLHRIVSITGNTVILKGDGNLNQTEKCTIDNIHAKAMAIVAPDGSERAVKSADRWNKLPLIVRRYSLGLARRLL